MERNYRGLLAAALALCVALVTLGTALPAHARPVVGFEAGNIVSDTLFYDGSAMTAADIQKFLNTRVPSCWLGKPGYEVGKQVTWGGKATKLASKCTRDYKVKTETRAANAYCAAYAGSASESAAQIIAKVGKSCGISQRVLLVMLEKEQSLITDPWPNNEQYFRAMGYACPDSGPGGTANCDPKQGGFFQQVYRAAWQLKVYKALPNNYNYKPFKTNYIQWHPNVSCGGSNVYIKNRATAALYIYTPYQPNKKALEVGSGTGDACSSYGNRNFFNLFKAWFGTPNAAFEVTGKIFDYWQTYQGWLGQPKANATGASANGGGRIQQFTGGTVFEPKAAGAKVSGMTTASPILAAHNKAGGVAGSWGWPTAGAVNQGSSGNNTMQFQNGIGVESTQAGVFVVPTALAADWKASGGFSGSWGYPIAAATQAGGATHQRFKNLTAGKAGSGKVAAVGNPFGPKWIENGGVTGKLGAPTGKLTSIASGGGGKRLDFGGGTMLNSGAGTFVLPAGALRDGYFAAGGPEGTWGWPTGRYLCNAANTECSMTFTNGVGVWTSSRGLLFTKSAVPSVTGSKPGTGESVTGGAVE